ncbi:MAG TPA: dephospho-CoA kinase [Micromonosporaceae bacterium]
MLLIGLTGGIGAGKSAVAGRLAALGAVLVDADVVARDVVEPGSAGLRAVAAAFGPEVLRADGALDRPALAARVFGDEEARRLLEHIIHPLVRARTAELIAAAPPDAVVVNDVPLLVETGLAPTYHLVVVVDADERLRVDRLVRARGMTEADAYARIRAQADHEARAAAADVLLVNDGTLPELHARVDALWRDRIVPYEANLRHGRVVRPTTGTDPVAYDPTWPAQYGRLAARIRHAAGKRAGRVDHIGSTAIPGLPARDVIDIQLGVRPAADAEALVPALRAAGFVGGERVDGADRPEWVFGGADPARAVRLHVREEGSAGWRRALLLRDWLRGDPTADRAGADSAAADGPRVATALDGAEGWAAATGWRP